MNNVIGASSHQQFQRHTLFLDTNFPHLHEYLKTIGSAKNNFFFFSET